MQELFENWRRFVNEASQLTIDRDIFIKKVIEFIEQQGMEGATSRAPQNVTGGESVQDIFYMLNKKNIAPVGINVGSIPQDLDLEKFKAELTQFGLRRGWNLLLFDDYVESRGMISLKFDSDRGTKENYVTAGEIASLSDVDKYYLFHITAVDTAQKILSQGIKPTRVSGDGVRFANGRAYFFIGPVPPQDVIMALDPMQGGEIASGAKGLKTVLMIDPAKINKNIKFTIDTEFDDVDAIWTQSHIKASPDAIRELTRYRQSEEDFQDDPEDDYYDN